MSDTRKHNRSVRIMTTLALIALAASAAGFTWGCSKSSEKPAATNTNTASPPSDNDVHVKVDLPDTVTIKP